jgi:K+-sensing histidine kinase KdpD
MTCDGRTHPVYAWLTPALVGEALIQRMKHGSIYPPEQAGRALESFFTPGNLPALRDSALRATACEVEDQLDVYIRDPPSRTQIACRSPRPLRLYGGCVTRR